MNKNVTIAIFVVFLISFATDALSEGNEKIFKYQLQIDRFGPVIVGMTPKEASAKLGIPIAPIDPPDEDESACFYIFPKGMSADIGFMVEEGRITRIDILSKRISSMNGIRIGDSENSVRKAFSGKFKEEVHPYLGKEGKYLIIEPTPGFGFIFETDKGIITFFRSGKMKSVQYIEGCL